MYKNLKDMSIIKEAVNPQTPFSATGSFCVPRTFYDWLDLRSEFANDRAREARQALYMLQEHQHVRRHPDLPPAGETAPITILPYGGKLFGDTKAPTLAVPTVWHRWQPEALRRTVPDDERPVPPWPCEEEMREEGNERMTSGFRRFPALPRVPGNNTVNWKQKKMLPMLPFDEIWHQPTKETHVYQKAILAPIDRIRMERKIGGDLMAALDCSIDDYV